MRHPPYQPPLLAAAFGLAVGLIAGCSTGEPLPPADGGETSPEERTRFGSIVAEFDQQSDGDISPARVDAQFIDARGVELRSALRALEVWRADGGLDRDSCRMLDDLEADRRAHDRPDRPAAQLRLLSVGPISVDGPRHDLELRARRLPDLFSAFSGVVYGTERAPSDRSRPDLLFEEDATYTFRAPGDGATGGFEVALEAPAPIRIRDVSGLRADDRLSLSNGSDLRIRWNDAPEATGDVFLDLAAGPGPDHPRVQCRLEDDGAFSLPAEIPGEIARSSSSIDLTLRRVDTERVDVAGLDATEFVLTTADKRHLSADSADSAHSSPVERRTR